MRTRRLLEINQRFGRLVVLEINKSPEQKQTFVKLKCDCGTIKITTQRQLFGGNPRSCGCLVRDNLIERNKKNAGIERPALNKNPVHPGEEFNRLTVIGVGKEVNLDPFMVLVRCECGEQFNLDQYNLRNGVAKSCGCLRREKFIERLKARSILGGNMKRIPGYSSWKFMKSRCLDPNAHDYCRYGGRGIKICDKWLSFPGFYEDMGVRPKGLTIERKDNDGNYEPGNCVWATPQMQNRNRKGALIVILDNEKITLHEARRKLRMRLNGIPAVQKRLNYSLQEAFEFCVNFTKTGGKRISYKNLKLPQVN